MTSDRESRTSRRARAHGPAKEQKRNQKHTENRRRKSHSIHKHKTTKDGSKFRKNRESFHWKQRRTRRKSTKQNRMNGRRTQQKESIKKPARERQTYELHRTTYRKWPAIFVARLNTGAPNEYKGDMWIFKSNRNSSYIHLHRRSEDGTVTTQARYIHTVPHNQYPEIWERLLNEMSMPRLDASERTYAHNYECAYTAREEAWAKLERHGCIKSVRRNQGWVRKKWPRQNKRPNKKSGESRVARWLMMYILFG